MLVDKAYPSWPAEERLELVRNQFIHGILSPSIQLKLLQQNLDTLDAAVELACRLESVESAQSSFQTAKVAAGVTETRDGSEEGAQPGYQDLVAQVKSLSHQLDTLRRGKQTGPRSFRGPCWECGKPSHVRRNCPQLRRDQTTRDRGDRSVHFTSAVACTMTLQGAVEGHPTVMLVVRRHRFICHDIALVSYPDPDSHSCGWITSPLRGPLSRSGDVIHPQLWESGSGYETNIA